MTPEQMKQLALDTVIKYDTYCHISDNEKERFIEMLLDFASQVNQPSGSLQAIELIKSFLSIALRRGESTYWEGVIKQCCGILGVDLPPQQPTPTIPRIGATIAERAREYAENFIDENPYALIAAYMEGAREIGATEGIAEREKQRTFTETEIEHLQSDVHKITGDGEVMKLFNKLLGVMAG